MNELNFLDLVVLRKTDAESSVEKFGSLINTSFFETANLLGTMKIKGYIDIESSVGGMSRVTLTDAGKGILALADQKAAEPIEPLDNAVLHALAGGAKDPESLQNALNIRASDLAYHVNKLVTQGFMDYSVRSSHISFALTEQGFNSTGGVRVQQILPSTQQSKESPLQQGGAPSEESKMDEEAAEISGSREPAHAPPWVKPSDVAPAGQKKEDVEHLMKEEEPKHAEQRHAKKPKKPLSPEEQKAAERRRRMLSKLHYYALEYAPYLALILVLAGVFVGAVFLSVSKLA